MRPRPNAPRHRRRPRARPRSRRCAAPRRASTADAPRAGDRQPDDRQPDDLRPGDRRPGDLRPNDLRPGDQRLAARRVTVLPAIDRRGHVLRATERGPIGRRRAHARPIASVRRTARVQPIASVRPAATVRRTAEGPSVRPVLRRARAHSGQARPEASVRALDEASVRAPAEASGQARPEASVRAPAEASVRALAEASGLPLRVLLPTVRARTPRVRSPPAGLLAVHPLAAPEGPHRAARRTSLAASGVLRDSKANRLRGTVLPPWSSAPSPISMSSSRS